MFIKFFDDVAANRECTVYRNSMMKEMLSLSISQRVCHKNVFIAGGLTDRIAVYFICDKKRFTFA